MAKVPFAGQGAAADHIKESSSQIGPASGSTQQLQAMKEVFQNQLKGSKKCPKDGPRPLGPLSSFQAPGCFRQQGCSRTLAERQLGAQDPARVLEPSDFGQVASPL